MALCTYTSHLVPSSDGVVDEIIFENEDSVGMSVDRNGESVKKVGKALLNMVPVYEPGVFAILENLHNVRVSLEKCSDNFERIRIRDIAKALESASEILQLTDIQVEASILVQDAERVLAKANLSRQRRTE